MSHYPTHAILGLTLLLVGAAVRFLTVNRLIRRKLRLSVGLGVAYLVLE